MGGGGWFAVGDVIRVYAVMKSAIPLKHGTQDRKWLYSVTASHRFIYNGFHDAQELMIALTFSPERIPTKLNTIDL